MSDPLAWLDDALADVDRRALRRTLSVRHSAQRDLVCLDDQELVNFGSNDYLGLAADPRMASEVRQWLDEFGWGSGASPLLGGRSLLHLSLEAELAGFKKTEAALLFPTGFAANVGAITALAGPDDAIYSDARNHASIIDGCRLSGASIHVFRHRDIDHLRELLVAAPSFKRRLIVTDTLFSMDGDFAPLPQLVQLAADHSAMLMVDEAHATGVFGQHGRGIGERFGVESGIHVHVGTLSKALGSLGGFVAGSQRLIDWLANRARTYMFSTAVPAVAAAAGRKALWHVLYDSQRREKLLITAKRLRDRLRCADLNIGDSESQIIPVILGDPSRALTAAAELRQMGIFVPAIRPPSVPDGHSLLRISLTCLHTDQQIEDLVAALASAVA